VDNQAEQLLPGAFANVHFDLPLASADLSVPASALIFDHNGVRVATIGPENRIDFKPVSIARDLGDVVQISSGLAANDRIVDSPPDGIGKGDQVRIATGTTNGSTVAAAPSGPSVQGGAK